MNPLTQALDYEREAEAMRHQIESLKAQLAEARRDAERMRGILHEIADDAPTEDTTMEDATSGGQFDDAFYGGYDAGVYMCAQIARKGIDAARAAEEAK